jgi:hypothetical protein
MGGRVIVTTLRLWRAAVRLQIFLPNLGSVLVTNGRRQAVDLLLRVAADGSHAPLAPVATIVDGMSRRAWPSRLSALVVAGTQSPAVQKKTASRIPRDRRCQTRRRAQRRSGGRSIAGAASLPSFGSPRTVSLSR